MEPKNFIGEAMIGFLVILYGLLKLQPLIVYFCAFLRPYQKWFETRPVNQICNGQSKIANLLYSRPSPSLPHSLSAKTISNKIPSTYQKFIFTHLKKITKYHNVAY